MQPFAQLSMSARLGAVAGAMALCALAGPVASASAQAAPCVDADLELMPGNEPRVRAAMTCLLNNELVVRGLRPVVASPALELAAQRHSEDMLARAYVDHIARAPAPHGAEPADRARAAGYPALDNVEETIGAGDLHTARKALTGWLRSGGHCAVILNGNNTEVGLGVAWQVVGGNPGEARWTLNLATTNPIPVTQAAFDARRGCSYQALLTPDAFGNLEPGAGVGSFNVSPGPAVGCPGRGTVLTWENINCGRGAGGPVPGGSGSPAGSGTSTPAPGGATTTPARPKLRISGVRYTSANRRVRVTGQVTPRGAVTRVRVTVTSPGRATRRVTVRVDRNGRFTANVTRVRVGSRFKVALRSVGLKQAVTASRTVRLR